MTEAPTSQLLRDVAMQPGRRRLPMAGPEPQAGIPASTAEPVPMDPTELAELSRVRELARSQGLAEGLAAAEQRIASTLESMKRELDSQLELLRVQQQAEHAQRLRQLDVLLKTIGQSTAQRLKSLEAQAITLAYEAACKVLGPGEARHRTITDLIGQGIASMKSGVLVAVRVHPADLGAMESEPAFVELSKRHAHVRWQADASLAPGGCKLETDYGALDITLSSQLDRLREAWSQAYAAETAADEQPRG